MEQNTKPIKFINDCLYLAEEALSLLKQAEEENEFILSMICWIADQDGAIAAVDWARKKLSKI